MIRIALVEDEAEVRAQLQGYVQRHTRQYGTEFAVTEFADGMELLDDYRPVYDILFLDVEMKHLDGMETARRDAAAGFVPHLLSGKRGTPRPFLYRRGRFRGGRHPESL